MYIADSMGVRDIYDTDGDSAICIKEPLAVLVSCFKNLLPQSPLMLDVSTFQCSIRLHPILKARSVKSRFLLCFSHGCFEAIDGCMTGEQGYCECQ